MITPLQYQRRSQLQLHDPPGTKRRRWIRGAIATALLGAWCFASTYGASVQWQDYPYSGPFVCFLMQGWRGIVNACSVSMWVVILVPTGLWVWTGRDWAAILALLVSAVTFVLVF